MESRIVDLQQNRRSHAAIIAWPNRYLYEDRMRAHGDADITDRMLQWDELPNKDFPIIFHGIKGTEKRTRRSPSYYNILEASIVRDYCVKLTTSPGRKIRECGASFLFSIVVSLHRCRSGRYWHHRTVQGPGQDHPGIAEDGEIGGNFSGLGRAIPGTGLLWVTCPSWGGAYFELQERKVIIMATTRSNEEYHPRRALGFVMNPRRMNGQLFSHLLTHPTCEADVHLASGHYPRAVLTYHDWGPRSARKGRLLAHIYQLYQTTQGVERKRAQLEGQRRRSGARAGNRPEKWRCRVRERIYRRKKRRGL